jgi:hypothetical protein
MMMMMTTTTDIAGIWPDRADVASDGTRPDIVTRVNRRARCPLADRNRLGGRDVAFWHFSDMPHGLREVRSLG